MIHISAHEMIRHIDASFEHLGVCIVRGGVNECMQSSQLSSADAASRGVGSVGKLVPEILDASVRKDAAMLCNQRITLFAGGGQQRLQASTKDLEHEFGVVCVD